MRVVVHHGRFATRLADGLARAHPDVSVELNTDEGSVPEHLEDAEVLIGVRFASGMLARAKRLRLLQLTGVGADHIEPLPATVAVTHAGSVPARSVWRSSPAWRPCVSPTAGPSSACPRELQSPAGVRSSEGASSSSGSAASAPPFELPRRRTGGRNGIWWWWTTRSSRHRLARSSSSASLVSAVTAACCSAWASRSAPTSLRCSRATRSPTCSRGAARWIPLNSSSRCRRSSGARSSASRSTSRGAARCSGSPSSAPRIGSRPFARPRSSPRGTARSLGAPEVVQRLPLALTEARGRASPACRPTQRHASRDHAAPWARGQCLRALRQHR